MTTVTANLPKVDLRKAFRPTVFYLSRPIRLIREYDRSDFRPDFIAGLTVAVILLPQAIAFALIAELPPEMGLYAAVVGGIVGALWGCSDQLHNGPTNAHSLLVLSTLSASALPGTPEYIIAAGVLTLMVGVIQLVMGLARLGVLVNFVSHSVIVGFASGAGVLIALKQLKPLFGLDFPGNAILETLTGVIINLPSASLATTAIGIGTMILIVVLGRINRKIPAALVAMIVTSLIVFIFGLADGDVEVIGSLPSGLPPVADLSFNLDLVRSLATGALAVAAIGLVETTAITRSVATQTGQRLDSNQEFVGQGLANLGVGIFSGFTVAGSFSRTAVNLRSGARTPVSVILSGIFVLIAMFALGPAAAYLPVAALAGVLIVTAYRMIDFAEIQRILRGTRGDAVIMTVTFFGTLFLHIETAVLIGIVLSFVRYIIRTSTPRVHMVVPDEEHHHFIYDPERPDCPQLGIVEILGDLYFGAVNHVEEFILEHAAQNPEQRYLLLRMHNVNNCDFSGIHMLESVVRYYRDRGGDVYLIRAGYRVRDVMRSTGFEQYLGVDHFLNDDRAISQIFYHVLDPAICIYECPVRVFSECQNLPKRLDLMDLPVSTAPLEEEPVLITPEELWQRLHRGDNGGLPFILDVREPREFRAGHIQEAKSVPLPRILAGGAAEEVPEDRGIVLVCRSGRRSRLAAARLQRTGRMSVEILDGGMVAWEAAGLLEAIDTFSGNGEGTESR